MVGVYRIHEPGGPEVMRWEEEDLGTPAPGMAEVRHTAIGLNYIDTYHRSGLYKLPLPTRLGVEGAGVVEAVGDGVEGISVGDRVAYSGGLGAYAEAIHMPAGRLVKLPEGVSEETAAATMYSCTRRQAARASFSANGHTISAPESSVPQAAQTKPPWLEKTVQSTRFSIVMKMWPNAFARSRMAKV